MDRWSRPISRGCRSCRGGNLALAPGVERVVNEPALEPHRLPVEVVLGAHQPSALPQACGPASTTRSGQARHHMKQTVLGTNRDLVRLGDRTLRAPLVEPGPKADA